MLYEKIFSVIVCISIVLLTGCAANVLNPQAAKVIVSHEKPAKSCEYKGMITANQGNFFTGNYTSNANLQSGAFNDLRNKAFELWGNYVQLVMQQAGVTGSGSGFYGNNNHFYGGGGGSRQTNVSLTGNVYHCKNNAQ